jgi:hypothetical protein
LIKRSDRSVPRSAQPVPFYPTAGRTGAKGWFLR